MDMLSESARSEIMLNKNLENRKYLREKEVSEIYGINRHTLARQRWGNYGLPYVIQGRKEGTNKGGIILYDIEDIEKSLKKKGDK